MERSFKQEVQALRLGAGETFHQGHSKNPSGDECDGLGAVLAEVFARLGHGQAAGSDEIEDEIAQRGERAGAGANPTAILVHRHVADVMQPVFDAPVGAREMKEPFWPGLGGGQAGDEVGDLGADLVADAGRARCVRPEWRRARRGEGPPRR